MILNKQNLRDSAFVVASVIAPFALAPAVALAQHDHPYHDAGHNDDHHWDSHEDKAYRIWAKENHRKYVAFDKLKEEDRQSYWGWRHSHDDALLKITIK